MHPVWFIFHHITQYFSTLTKGFICAVQSVHHVIVCGALFLQLWKPFCSVGTDLSRVLLLWLYFSPVFLSLSFSLAPCDVFLHCPSSQTWPITWWWMTSLSRSSCWLLAWPRPGSEARPRLLLSCGGATWSRHCLPWLLCSAFLVTDQKASVAVTATAVKR